LSKAIISDAGPLIAFARMDQLSLLTTVFDAVIIPLIVAQECLVDLSRPGAIAIDEAIKHQIIEVDDQIILPADHCFREILGDSDSACCRNRLPIINR